MSRGQNSRDGTKGRAKDDQKEKDSESPMPRQATVKASLVSEKVVRKDLESLA